MSVVHGGNVVVDGPILLAAGVAALAGFLSFASPCCLPLVPGYLSLVSGSLGAHLMSARGRDCAAPDQSPDRSARLRTTAGAVLFVTGFAAVFTAYGAAFGALGRALVLHQRALTVAFGSLTVLLGVSFAGLLPRAPWAWRSWRVSYRPRAGLLGAPLLGVLFGLGWTPCIGPTLSSVLALATTTAGATRGAVLAFVYSLGLGLPFVFAAAFADRAARTFAWPRRHALALMRVGGVSLALLGAAQVTGLWSQLVTVAQGWAANWGTTL